MRPPAPRSRRFRVLSALVGLVVVSGVAGVWLLLKDHETAAAATATATVSRQSVKESVAASGTVVAADSADLAFDVSGTVTDIFVRAGDKVRKGQRLAAIDDTLLQASLDAARSSLDAATSALSEAEDGGESDTQVAAARAAVVAAESELASAKQDVGEAVLRATFRGTVTDVGLAIGDRVGSPTGGTGTSTSGSASTGDGASSGTSSTSQVISVVTTGRYSVETTVASADVDRVKPGLQAEVTVQGVDEAVYGTVKEVGLVAETSSSGAAVFPVTIEVTGTRDDLFAGTTADATITTKQRSDVLTVDSRAVTTAGGKTYVQLRDPDTGKATRTEITIGDVYGLLTEVKDGLEEGDVVEYTGFAAPRGGRQDSDGGADNLQGPPTFQGDFPGGDVPGGLPGGFAGGGQ